MKNCECKRCIRHDYAKKITEQGSHQDKSEYICMLLNSMSETEMDLEYAERILDGTWPNSVAILERALVKAKKILTPHEEEDTRGEDRDEWKHKASEQRRLK